MMYDQSRARQLPDRPAGHTERRASGPEPLLPPDEREKIVQRLGRALNHFADTPREALEEAEGAYDDTVAQLVEALAEQRRVLRARWEEGQDAGTHDAGTPDTGAQDAETPDLGAQDTEAQSAELRLAVRQYREVIQRLLRL